jgi:predicted PurR-regulated permease PerM
MKLDRWSAGEAERAGGRARDSGRPARTPTPIFVPPRVMALIVVLGIAALAYVLYAAPSILIVALGGTALAILLSFPVRALRRVMPRGLAILVTFLGMIGLVTLTLVFLVPLLVRQLRNFILITPAIANNANDFLLGLIEPLAESGLLPIPAEDVMAGLVQNLFDRAREIIEGLLGGLVGFISGALNIGIVVFGMLFVAVYLLADVRKVKATFLKAAPKRYRRDALDLWEAFGVSLSRYLGGLLFVVVIQGVLAGLALWILGVPYAILLGAWVSLTAIIPYLGAFLGGIPAVLVALIFESPTIAVLTVVVYVLIQQLELAGVIFAVPALAVLRVFFDFFRARIRTKR